MDPLTGLPQRPAMLGWLTDALRRIGPDLAVGVALVNVDGFSVVIESLGVRAADTVLRILAQRLRAACAAADVLVARAGGDEFALVLPSIADAGDAERLVAEVVEATFGSALTVAGQPLFVTATAGIAVSPPGEADELVRRATVTLTATKRVGGGRIAVYRPRASVSLGNLALYAELRDALDRDELTVHYQPVVDIVRSQVVGLEALLRWEHPVHGVVGPAEFLPPVADSHLIEELGARALRQAARETTALLRRLPDLGYVAVNVAPRQLSNRGFAAQVLTTIDEAGLRPDHLVLEITETALVEDVSAAKATLGSLRGHGVRIAIDDFGTGYASLTSLRQLPIDMLKIDRTFVAGLGACDEDATIVASVASLARSIGLEAVAEGIETPAQADAARALGVGRGQGYLWSRAVARSAVPDAVAAIHRNRRPSPRQPEPLPAGPVESRRILELHRAGASPQTISAALNRAGLRTTSGSRWHATQVLKVIDAAMSGAARA